MAFEMLSYLLEVSNVSLNWDWSVYISFLLQIWRIVFGGFFVVFIFPAVLKKKNKSVHYVKRKLGDNLKVLSFLFVFCSVVTSKCSFDTVIVKQFSCSLASVARGEGDSKRSGQKMLN